MNVYTMTPQHQHQLRGDHGLILMIFNTLKYYILLIIRYCIISITVRCLHFDITCFVAIALVNVVLLLLSCVTYHCGEMLQAQNKMKCSRNLPYY